MSAKFDCKFRHPFSIFLSGPSGSGKTSLLLTLLSEYKQVTDIDDDQLRVLWCYGIWQPLYALEPPENLEIEYHKGLDYDCVEKDIHLVVIDDLMEELAKDKSLVSLFTRDSHHRNISVIFISQNLFPRTQQMRTISLNTHANIYMASPRTRSQVEAHGRQSFPHDPLFFSAAYEEATKEPFSHLLADWTPQCPNEMRLRQRKSIKVGEKDVRGWEIYGRR